MVVDWEQQTGLLMSSGDVRIIRIWDTDRSDEGAGEHTIPLRGFPGRSRQCAQTPPSSPGPLTLKVKGQE